MFDALVFVVFSLGGGCGIWFACWRYECSRAQRAASRVTPRPSEPSGLTDPFDHFIFRSEPHETLIEWVLALEPPRPKPKPSIADPGMLEHYCRRARDDTFWPITTDQSLQHALARQQLTALARQQQLTALAPQQLTALARQQQLTALARQQQKPPTGLLTAIGGGVGAGLFPR